MSKATHITDTDDAWESGELGRDEESVVAVDHNETALNEALGLQPISIRLEKALIEDFKMIASIHGLSYQPLMRQALRRFADGEKRRLLQEAACRARAEVEAVAERAKPREKRVA
ncbi:hypothetical protein AVE30378_01006 [Achromobacter veterisilvae]|uniref:Uncharacterized protein n=1 Tax=Achromobacter veterisilvae TaxID=2069367 RepID=A0A446C8Z8_9BURK|nr:hypothetical protein [Achromobacter veterisilvae]SSW64304.1 hypothetical protein AVE30378_01006 [Achromobacter veterisilvae]